MFSDPTLQLCRDELRLGSACLKLLTSNSEIVGPLCGRRKMSCTHTFTSEEGFSHRCSDFFASHALSSSHLLTPIRVVGFHRSVKFTAIFTSCRVMTTIVVRL